VAIRKWVDLGLRLIRKSGGLMLCIVNPSHRRQMAEPANKKLPQPPEGVEY
jgi:hypothetical protein